MASIAQDKKGDIALGYSLASPTVYDSIYATGRVPTRSVGTDGSRDGPDRRHRLAKRRPALGRLLQHVIDGSDGCTFWYTQEYYIVPAGGSQLADAVELVQVQRLPVGSIDRAGVGSDDLRQRVNSWLNRTPGSSPEACRLLTGRFDLPRYLFPVLPSENRHARLPSVPAPDK